MNKMISTCGLASVALCLMSTAQSSIVGFDTNKVVEDELANYTTIGNNNINTNGKIYAFQEKEQSGYSSHLIAFDPLTQQTINTSITFGSNIVAVIHSSSGLKGSNSAFGVGDIYDIVKYSGLDNVGGGYDSYTVLGNKITLNLRASDPGDYIRVITTDENAGATTGGPTIEDLLVGMDKEDFTSFDVNADGKITTVGPDGFPERGSVPSLLAARTAPLQSSDETEVTIPEPGTLALLGFGLGLAGLRRRPVSP